MRSLIIADRTFATNERVMLSRLEVGLADEGVRVVHAAPIGVESGPSLGLYSAHVSYTDASSMGMSMVIRRRARALLKKIDALDEDDSSISVVHAFGAPCWALALEVARQCGAGVLLELWRPGLIGAAASLVSSSGPPIGFLVSSPMVLDALHKRVRSAWVTLAPWGVHASDPPRTQNLQGRPISIALSCDTGEIKAIRPVLSGLAKVREAGQELLIFAAVQDATPAREAMLWAQARALGLLDVLSMTPSLESRREPVLDMDILLLPEATGRQRTLTLEALATGMIVVAAADPFMDTLIDGRTCVCVGASTAHAWAEAIASLVQNPDRVRKLAIDAHVFVREKRVASDQIHAVLGAYAQIAARASSVHPAT